LEGIVGWALQPKGNPIGRMASVFMYANILAAYLQIVFILALGLWIEESKKRSPQSRRLSTATLEKRAEAKAKTKYIFPFPIAWRMGFLSVAVIGNAAALILTNSRNAWAIVVLSCLAFAFYQGWRWLVALVTGIATSILWAAFGPSPVREWLRTIVPYYFWARLTDQMYPDRPVALLRTTQWQFAWSMTQQRPWTGWGLRNFTPLYEAQMKVWLGHPHSLLLMLTAETGIPATIFFCGLVGWVMVQAVLLLGETQLIPFLKNKLILFSYLVAFGACTLFNTVDVSIFDLRVNTLGWLLLAAICGVVYQTRAIAINLS
jgi:O-antigen ligase